MTTPDVGDGRIRVVQLIARLNVGGPATQVLALADGLDPGRFDVTIAAGSVADDEADHLAVRAPGIEVEVVPGLGRAVRTGADARAAAGVRRLIRRIRPHVVHTHTAKAGVLGRTVASRLGVPTVHTFHGHLLHGYFGPTGTRAVVTVERRLARRTGCLIAVGAQVRDDLVVAGIGGPDRYRVVPPGIEPPEQVPRDQARRDLGVPDDAEVIAFVGRLTAIKRPDRLLDALSSLASAGRRPTVLVAGDGELRADLERDVADRRLDVRFLGWRADVGRVFGAADLAVLTSDNEGMPVALIEAAHCGVPAVATDVGSVREVVVDGETGLLTTPAAASVAETVRRLLDDPGRRATLGSAAALHAAATFSPVRLAAATAEVYEELVAERRARRRPSGL